MRCDSHVHIVGPVEQYPQVASRTYLAQPAPLAQIRSLAATRGIARFVVVQPSFYGADNTVLLESLDALGPHGRGVAVIDPRTATTDMLSQYADRGVRGVRLNLYSPIGNANNAGLSAAFDAAAALAAPRDWHVEVIASLAVLATAADVLAQARASAPVRVVIDHYGVYGNSRPTSAAAGRMLQLLRLPHVWMKLSAPYRVSDDPLNTKPDPEWLAALLDVAEQRCVWGSDWPFTPPYDVQKGADIAAGYRPLSYAKLVDDFIRAVGSDARSELIMQHNPARLYGF